MKGLLKYIIVFCLILKGNILLGQVMVPHEQSTASENGLTGFSSAISGGWALVASPQKDSNGKKSVGSVTFYQLTDGQWKIFQEVIPSDISDLGHFGMSVAIEGNTAVMSATGDHDGSLFSGAAYVYEYSFTENSWVQTAKLKASDLGLGMRFGHSVDVLGDVIVVGSYNANGASVKTGANYVFRKVNDVWQEEQKIFAGGGQANDYFGHHVKILNENCIAVGAYNSDGAQERSGAVHIYKRTGAAWLEQAKLFDPNGESSDLFGYSIAFAEDISESSETDVLPGVLLIGAPGSKIENNKTGSVYFYIESASGWELKYELVEPESDHNDHFGKSISANRKGHLFVGASRTNNDTSLNAGRVYFYEIIEGDGMMANSVVQLNSDFINAYDQFGTHVVIDDENIVIGSPYADTNKVTNSGAVNFFRMNSFLSEESDLDEIYALDQNIPNPSVGNSVIQYGMKRSGDVKISLYNLNGQLVSVLVDEYKEFGVYTYDLDTRGLATGVYVYKIEVNNFAAEKKMIVGR